MMTTEKLNQTEIDAGIAKIEAALEGCDALCTCERPCAAVVSYEPSESQPWRLADDWYSRSFATVEEAIVAAATWYEEK